LTAALYLAREGVDTLVVERAGLGGQAGITQRLDNFPGFDEGIGGAEFAERLSRQARRFGVEILQAQEVQAITPDGDYWCVMLSDGNEHAARAVLLATGARYRRLGVPGEDDLIGVNLHFCATCDGPFYRGKRVLVIGGGNSGFEEGLYLSQIAAQVDIVEFSPQVKASKILQDKVAKQDNMRLILNHEVKEFLGKDRLLGILVEDRSTGQTHTWDYDGVFVFIGLAPNSDLLRDRSEADDGGFLVTDSTLMTSLPGIFAAGDVRAGSTKQAASAAGEGATAALMVRDYLRRKA
jgi:thioredoxin reductase (NADPH)